MRKAAPVIFILCQLFIQNQCSSPEITKEGSLAQEPVKVREEKSHSEGSVLSVFSKLDGESRNDLKEKEQSISQQKKIPFRKLFVKNITFTENKGQLERFGNFYSEELKQVKFYSKAFNGTAYFASNGIGFGFQRGGLNHLDNVENNSEVEKLSKAERREVIGFNIEFLNSNKNVQIKGEKQQHTKLNYLKGENPNAFITDIASFEQLKYQDLYKGIDLVYYTKEDQLKYDYIVKPGSKVSDIKMRYKGVKDIKINESGELEVGVEWGVLYDKKPYSYQMINGVKEEVEVEYVKIDSKTIGFKVKGNYDQSVDLVIDPFTVQWSTYIGSNGPGADNGYIEATTVDNSGAVLGTGWSNSSFPISSSGNGYDKSHNGAEDAFVFKLQGNGTTMDFVTYIGGSGFEVGTGIAVASTGEVCLSGYTQSYSSSILRENPSTTTLTVGTGSVEVNVAAIGVYPNPCDILLVNGTNLMYGTLTGFNGGTKIVVNITSTVGSGTYGTWQVYQLTQVGFPTTAGAIQANNATSNGLADIFFAKLSSTGNALNYSTLYGGTDNDWSLDMVLDNSNHAYLTGRTQSSGLATGGAYRPAYSGGFESFAFKINSANTLGYFTYVGGAGNDVGKSIAVNSTGDAYVVGMTNSGGLATAGAFQSAITAMDDAYVVRLNSTGTAATYFTYLGGTEVDMAGGIKLINDDAVVVGTAGSGFPMQTPYDNVAVGSEGFLTRINSTGTALVYSTYVGGNGADNTKGFDYFQYHKNGGIEIVNNQPIVVISTASSAGMPNVNPFNFTAVQNDGVSTYTYDGSTFKGGGVGDMYIVVFDATAQSVLYGSYYGGSDNDYPTAGVNADRSNSNGCIVIAGGVHSLPFPTTVGAFQTRRYNTINEDQHALVKICLPEILPVELLNFTGFWNGDITRLNWTTTSEKNSDYFVVEKSTDGITFYPIGTVPATGYSQDLISYSHIDSEPAFGTNYYRLKQFDLDGTFHYSKTIRVITGEMPSFLISPNPGDGLFHAEGNLSEAGEVRISVINEIGQEIVNKVESREKGNCKIEIDLRNYADGIYILKISSGEFSQVEKLKKE